MIMRWARMRGFPPHAPYRQQKQGQIQEESSAHISELWQLPLQTPYDKTKWAPEHSSTTRQTMNCNHCTWPKSALALPITLHPLLAAWPTIRGYVTIDFQTSLGCSDSVSQFAHVTAGTVLGAATARWQLADFDGY